MTRAARFAPLVAIGAALSGAPDAVATERFASPDETRTGEDCLSIAHACSLGKALSESSPSLIVGTHTVTLLPGSYDSADIAAGDPNEFADIVATTGLTIQGQPGSPAPTIEVSAPANLLKTVDLRAGGILRNLTIRRTGAVGATAVGLKGFAAEFSSPEVPALMDHVTVESSAGSFAVVAEGVATITNSLIRQSGGTGGIGVSARPSDIATPRIVSSTILSSGDALSAFSSLSKPASVQVVNTLLRGSRDVVGEVGGGGTGPLTVATTSSAYRPAAPTSTLTGNASVTGAAVVVADPSLDASGAPLAGSPLIDAGTAAPDIGTLDLAGHARVAGLLPDIGAFEFQAAPPATGGEAQGPTPEAPSNAGGSSTSTPPAVGANGSPAAASTPDTAKPTLGAPGLGRTLKRAKLKKGLPFTLTTSEAASIVVELVTTSTKKGRTVQTVLGSQTSRSPAAGSVTLTLKVKGSKLGAGKLKAKLRFTATDAAGNVGVLEQAVTVK